MRARLIASTVAVAVAAPIALAQSPHTLSGNMALVGDYRFRGLSQTYTQPAIQAGVEYAAATGAYGGGMRLERERQSVSEWRIARAGPVWRISWTVTKLGLDLGLQYYWYPRARYNIDPGDRYNTVESYLSVRYDHFSAKYSHALTHLFGMKTQTIGGYCGIGADGTPASTDCLGTGGTKGSGYVDLNATFDVVSRVGLAVHYGRQFVRSYDRLSYDDYRIGLTRPFGAVTLGAAVVTTDAERRFYRYTPTTAGSRETENVGKLGIVLSASKAF